MPRAEPQTNSKRIVSEQFSMLVRSRLHGSGAGQRRAPKQVELARESGFSQTHISQILSQQLPISPEDDRFKKLCAVLNIDPYMAFDWPGAMRPGTPIVVTIKGKDFNALIKSIHINPGSVAADILYIEPLFESCQYGVAQHLTQVPQMAPDGTANWKLAGAA